MHETPWGSVLDGRVDGVCIMLIFALLKKSAEPPKPFNILEPMTQVELACAYISLSLYQLRDCRAFEKHSHFDWGAE